MDAIASSAISYVVLNFLFRILRYWFTSQMYELFLNGNGFFAGAQYVLRHKDSAADCQKSSVGRNFVIGLYLGEFFEEDFGALVDCVHIGLSVEMYGKQIRVERLVPVMASPVADAGADICLRGLAGPLSGVGLLTHDVEVYIIGIEANGQPLPGALVYALVPYAYVMWIVGVGSTAVCSADEVGLLLKIIGIFLRQLAHGCRDVACRAHVVVGYVIALYEHLEQLIDG